SCAALHAPTPKLGNMRCLRADRNSHLSFAGREALTPKVRRLLVLALAQPPITPRTAEMDGLMFQIVHGADVADGAAFGAHEDRVGDRFFADEADAGEEGAVADAGGAEE